VGFPHPEEDRTLKRELLLRTVALAIAFLVVDAVMSSVSVSGGFLGALGVAFLYGVVSAVIGTALRLLSMPLVLITVGFFEFVINAVLLLFTDWLVGWLEIDGFGSALGAAVILALVSVMLGIVVWILVPERALD
jgi:putative membrane protein